MSALSTARADAVICRTAVRAIRRGDQPRAVAEFVATYSGLPLMVPPGANHPAKIVPDWDWDGDDDFDYTAYLTEQATAWCDNPPPAPPGFELIECEATPRHWPMYTVTDDDFYPGTCASCSYGFWHERERLLEHRAEHHSDRWTWLIRIGRRVGIVSGYGHASCSHARKHWCLISVHLRSPRELIKHWWTWRERRAWDRLWSE